MKNSIKCIFLAVLCLFLTLIKCYAALSGTYTIDPSKPASSTNYKDFSSVTSDLSGTARDDQGPRNGPGVSGALTFNIADGTYNESIDFQNISGLSAAKPIIFQSTSKDSSKVTIAFSSSLWGVCYMNNCSHFVFKQITFSGIGALVVEIDNCNNTVFTNCIFTSITGSNQAPYLIGLFESHDISILNSHLVNGGYSVYMEDGAKHNTNIKISGNTIEGTGGVYGDEYGIYCEQVDTFTIINNKMSILANASNGPYNISAMYFGGCTGPGLIKNNVILINYALLSGNGILIYGCKNIIICNNMISLLHNFFSVIKESGMILQGNQYCDVVYNTVLLDSANDNYSQCLSIVNTLGSNNRYLNNNLVNRIGRYAIKFTDVINSTDSSDYNNLVGKDTLIKWDTKGYLTLSSYKSGTRFDQHSVSIPQSFKSVRDLHNATNSLCYLGRPIAQVKDDIDGDIRDINNPYIGADESFLNYDLATINVLASKKSFCINEPISLRTIIKNKGLISDSSFNVRTVISGPKNSQINVSNTKKVNHNQTDTVTISTNLSFSTAGTYKLIVFHQLATDLYGANDSFTITLNVVSPPSASFTFNDACIGQLAYFSNTTTNALTTIYSWNFGDGGVSTLLSPTHKFSSGKSYKVLLTANKSNGCIDTVSSIITPYPQPNAAFTYTQNLYSAQFSPVDLSSKTYSWNFGDGATSNLTSPFHNYIITNNLAFNITLSVTSQYGCIDSTSNALALSASGMESIPKQLGNFSVYPNPFSDVTNFQYLLTSPGHVVLKLYNVQGGIEKELLNKAYAAGKYSFQINAVEMGLTPGIYHLTVNIDGNVATKKLVFLK